MNARSITAIGTNTVIGMTMAGVVGTTVAVITMDATTMMGVTAGTASAIAATGSRLLKLHAADKKRAGISPCPFI